MKRVIICGAFELELNETI